MNNNEKPKKIRIPKKKISDKSLNMSEMFQKYLEITGENIESLDSFSRIINTPMYEMYLNNMFEEEKEIKKEKILGPEDYQKELNEYILEIEKTELSDIDIDKFINKIQKLIDNGAVLEKVIQGRKITSKIILKFADNYDYMYKLFDEKIIEPSFKNNVILDTNNSYYMHKIIPFMVYLKEHNIEKLTSSINLNGSIVLFEFNKKLLNEGIIYLKKDLDDKHKYEYMKYVKNIKEYMENVELRLVDKFIEDISRNTIFTDKIIGKDSLLILKDKLDEFISNKFPSQDEPSIEK
jgi:hypothetical protein